MKASSKTAIVLLLLGSLLATSVFAKGSSAVGLYSTNSRATEAVHRTAPAEMMAAEAGWPAAAVAVVAAVGAVIAVAAFVIGAIDGWNSIHPQAIANVLHGEVQSSIYNPTDFSKFDN